MKRQARSKTSIAPKSKHSFLLTILWIHISQSFAHFPPKPVFTPIQFGSKRQKSDIFCTFFAGRLACFKKSSYFCIAIGSWCNGNTTGFGSVILGSNPGDPTKCADWLRYRRWRLARFCIYTPTSFFVSLPPFFPFSDYGITTIARQRYSHLRYELHCGAFS